MTEETIAQPEPEAEDLNIDKGYAQKNPDPYGRSFSNLGGMQGPVSAEYARQQTYYMVVNRPSAPTDMDTILKDADTLLNWLRKPITPL